MLLGPEAGRWTLVVEAVEAGAPPAPYVLRFESVATADADLQRRAAALAHLSAAGRLYAAGTPEGRQRAAERYRRAAMLWRDVGDPEAEAFARHARAVVLRLRGEMATAEEEAARAAGLWRRLERPFWLAMAEVERGLDLWQQAAGDAARSEFERALERLRPLDDAWAEAVVRSNLCLMELTSGRLDHGLTCYLDALPAVERARSREISAIVHTNLGRVLDVLGEPTRALGHYARALDLAERAENEVATARALNNSGVLRRELGDPLAAVEAYDRALEIFERLDDRRWTARVSNNLGYAYLELGSPARAEPYFRRALALWDELRGDDLGSQAGRRGAVRTLINLALLEETRGRHDAAEDLHRRAAARAETSGDRRLLTLVGYLEGRMLLAAGRPHDALEPLAAAAAELAAAGRPITEAVVRVQWGRALVDAGRAGDARPVLDRALELLRKSGQSQIEAAARHQRARAARTLGRHHEAMAEVNRAIALFDELGTRVGSAALRTTYAAVRFDPRELRLDLAMDAHRRDPAAGHHLRALEIAAADRARVLAERLGLPSGLAGGAQAAELRQRRDTLRRSLAAKLERLLRERDPGRVRLLEDGVLDTRRKLDLLSAGIRQAEERRDDVPRSGSESPGARLEARAIARLLDPGTVLLLYALGDERSYLWRVAAEGEIRVFELPPRERLEALARAVHRDLAAPGSAPSRAAPAMEEPDAARELVRLAIAPALDAESGGTVSRLVVMADGALHLLPFAALPDPASAIGAPLISRFEVVHPPSVPVLAALRRPGHAGGAPPRSLAVLADPAFAESSFEALPHSREEALAIARMADPRHLFVALGTDARPALLSGPEVRGKSVLHLATHGLLDVDDPARSGLVLAQVDEEGRERPGFLGLAEIYGLRLDADLVVLSACHTGRGRMLRGEGAAGLGHAFLATGARAVIASLWRVEDRATAELTARFYAALWRDGETPAAALRRAQLSIRSQRRWRDPYYWAPFVVLGDWRDPDDLSQAAAGPRRRAVR